MKRYFMKTMQTIRGGGLAMSFVCARSRRAVPDRIRKTSAAARSISGARRLACAIGAIVGLMGALPMAESQNPGGSAGGLVIGPQPPAQSSGLRLDVLGVPAGNGAILSPEADLDLNRSGRGVYVGTGQVVWVQEDLYVNGRDEVTNFEIKRRHISRRNYPNSIFGPAWTFNYDHKLQLDGAGDVIMESFGRTDVFKRVGNSDVWEGQEGRFGRLTYASGTYRLRMSHGTVLEFEADTVDGTKPAHLKKIISPGLNTLEFTYKTPGNIFERKLETIKDSYGRICTFFYEDTDYDKGVSRIRDFSGREVIYDYNAAGQLQSVRSPIVNSTGGLNDFPSGKVHRYQYVNHTDPRLKNALKSVIYPNQATANIPRVQFTYDENAGTNPSNPFFGFLKTLLLSEPLLRSGYRRVPDRGSRG